MPTATVTVDRPIGDVFALLADLTTHPTWSPDVVSASQITEIGPVGLGARFRIKIKGAGESEMEITVYDEPTRVEFRGSDKMGEARHLFSLTPEGDRTRVDQVLEMRLKGPWRLLTPVMAIMLRRGARTNATGLERHFHGGAK